MLQPILRIVCCALDAVFLVPLPTADSTISKCMNDINLMCGLVSFAQKWLVEMFLRGILTQILSTFKSLYFVTFTWVKRLNKYFLFYQSLMNMGSFATSASWWNTRSGQNQEGTGNSVSSSSNSSCYIKHTVISSLFLSWNSLQLQ